MSIEPNERIFEAVYTDLSCDNPGSFVTGGEIGDNSELIFGEDDVDFFQVQLEAGDRITADIDAEEFSSLLDSILRLFDSSGNEVGVSDDEFELNRV